MKHNTPNPRALSVVKKLAVAVTALALSMGPALAWKESPPLRQVSEKPFGEYLAGLHAARNSDLHMAADFYAKILALDPDDQMILRKSFSIFIADGQYDKASDVAHKLADDNVGDSMVQMYLFLEQMKTGNHDAALLALNNLGDAGVYGLFKPLFLSWVLLAKGDAKMAEANIEASLKDKNFLDFKKFHAGLFYDFLGKTHLAEQMYSEALLVPGALSLRTVEAYGILLQRIGRGEDARQLYTNYLEKAPENARLLRALADLDKGEKNKSPAVSLISSEAEGVAEIFYTAANFLMQDNIRTPATIYLQYAKYLKQDFFIADYLLGQIFEAELYYEGALKSYERIIRKHALYFRARLQMAWVLEKQGQVDQAIAAMTHLSQEFPKNTEIFAALGDVYRMHSRFDESAVAYSRLLKQLPAYKETHWSIFYTRGIVYEQGQKWDQAEADFLKALELRPDQPQVLNYLAYSWVDKGINVEKARVMLERAVELRPHDGYIIDSLGWALYRMGDMSKAVEYLEKAVLLQTDDWAINDHLGDAYWAVGRKNEAKFQWRHALSLKPDAELVAKIKTKIRDGK